MKQKINLRLTLIALVAVFSATIGVTLLYYNLFQSQVKKDLALYTRLLSDTGVFQAAYAGTEDVNAYVESSALRQLRHDNPRITWVTADGTVLYDNGADVSGLPNHLDRPEIREAIENGSGESIRRSDTFQLNTFYYALQLDDGTILRTSTQASSISNVFVQSLPVVFSISLIFLVICILLGHFLTIQLLRPLDQMAERLDSPINEPVYRELQPFADKIRSQHENILEAASMRQDFTANVSHELKTPLTAISGYAELLENNMVAPDQVTHVAEQIRHNSDRLLSLINDIIRLSELDHKELPQNSQPWIWHPWLKNAAEISPSAPGHTTSPWPAMENPPCSRETGTCSKNSSRTSSRMPSSTIAKTAPSWSGPARRRTTPSSLYRTPASASPKTSRSASLNDSTESTKAGPAKPAEPAWASQS